MKTSYLLVIIISLTSLFAQAQSTCGTDEYIEYLKSKDPAYEEKMEIKNAAIQRILETNTNPKPARTVITIPVVFHVVWKTTAQNLSDACLQDQIASMNRDFRKNNSDISNAPSQFQAIAADVEFEFCLASIDPQGNPTSGIVRKQTTVSNFGVSDNMKFSSSGGSDIWDSDNYLNIWICEIGSVGGFSSLGCTSSSVDGIVVHWKGTGNCDQIPSGGQGRDAVHEIGHWMGLSHTFQGGCSGMSASTCATAGDRVCDTPPVASNSVSFGCSSTTNTCSETPDQIDMIWNHMDYTHPQCKVLFTNDQKARMYAASSGCRSTIFSGAAAAAKCGVITEVNETILDENIKVYPNPSFNEVQIQYNKSLIEKPEYILFDTYGKAIQNIKEYVGENGNIALDITDLPVGIYFLHLSTKEKKTIKKIIKL